MPLNYPDDLRELNNACIAGDLPAVRRLSYVLDKYNEDRYPESPLFLAAKHGRINVVNYLLQNRKADPNHQVVIHAPTPLLESEVLFLQGMTPLHIAVKNNFPEIVTTLLNNGSSLFILDLNLRTPSTYAKSAEVADILRKQIQQIAAVEIAKLALWPSVSVVSSGHSTFSPKNSKPKLNVRTADILHPTPTSDEYSC